MHKLVWRPKAEQDLQSIIEWIWKNNPSRAISFAEEIQLKAARLLSFPLGYRVGQIPGTREMVLHSNYLLIYRVEDDTIEILRIKHVKLRE